jgi:hypothetical protein
VPWFDEMHKLVSPLIPFYMNILVSFIPPGDGYHCYKYGSRNVMPPGELGVTLIMAEGN